MTQCDRLTLPCRTDAGGTYSSFRSQGVGRLRPAPPAHDSMTSQCSRIGTTIRLTLPCRTEEVTCRCEDRGSMRRRGRIRELLAEGPQGAAGAALDHPRHRGDPVPSSFGVGEITETLRWGQPSYITSKPKSGTTIRTGLHRTTKATRFSSTVRRRWSKSFARAWKAWPGRSFASRETAPSCFVSDSDSRRRSCGSAWKRRCSITRSEQDGTETSTRNADCETRTRSQMRSGFHSLHIRVRVRIPHSAFLVRQK